mgnify:CR=1 FL=1
MEEKTYRERNIKFLASLLFVNIFSVTILLYLLSIGTFIPLKESGEYDWINISVFSSLLFVFLSSSLTLLALGFLTLVLKKENSDLLKFSVFKFGFLMTLGVFLVIMLNFFHILDIYWGAGILLVLLLLSFVI